MNRIMQTMIHELAHVKHDYHLFHFCWMQRKLMRKFRKAYESGAIEAIPSCEVPRTTGQVWHQVIEDVWEVSRDEPRQTLLDIHQVSAREHRKWIRRVPRKLVMALYHCIYRAERDWPKVVVPTRRNSV